MTLEETIKKWLEDHNGEPPDKIAFNPSYLEKLKVDPVKPNDFVQIGGMQIKLISSSYIPEGSCIFMAKGLELDMFNQPTEETIKSSILLRWGQL